MIVTLTPNPSLDRAITIPDLRRGEVIRATSSRVDPGGKGVNVARALAAQGADTIAVLPSGGPEGHMMEDLLDLAGVRHVTTPVEGSLRMNISVLEPDGTTTKLNEPGPTLTDRTVSELLAATLASATPGGWVVGCGSLPPGAPIDLYATLTSTAHAAGLKVAIDSSGGPMTQAVAAHPDLIKPNHEELEELVGRRLDTLADVRDAATTLVQDGIETVAVSLGGDGALLVTQDAFVHANATITTPRSTVGAGDCMLAGLLHGLSSGVPPADALAAAVTWGAAAVTLPGSRVPSPADLEGIPVRVNTSPDLSRSLRR
ncbi:MAG: 1-phosphofructokinase [Dermatophilaceae bacterium]|nr:1-phosphofructokinase [Intrasporangiaceae bacterium]